MGEMPSEDRANFHHEVTLSRMSRLLLSRPLVAFVFFVERWLFSALFLFLAWEHISTLRLMTLISQSKVVLPGSLVAHDGSFSDGVTFDDYARYILLAISFGACGVLLLISRRPKHGPTTAREIVIPFAATFSSMVFDQHIELPTWVVTPLVPDHWKPALASFGIVISMAGLTMSIYALLWLGRSMGIVVSVREVVLGGPYRWVRHPIYTGYLFVLLGMFMVSWTPRMGFVVFGAIALLVWRARLEEKLLSAHSLAYREWRQHTGFLWPRRGGAAPERFVVTEMQNAECKAQKSGIQSVAVGSSSAC